MGRTSPLSKPRDLGAPDVNALRLVRLDHPPTREPADLLASGHFYLGFASDGEVDGIRDEAEAVGFLMQILGQAFIAALFDAYRRAEDYLGEMTAFSAGLYHCSRRVIPVCCDYDPRIGTQVQVPEHVAG